MVCDSKSIEECLQRRCPYAAVPYLLGEQDPVVVCGKPREFEPPLTPLQELLKQYEQEWLGIEGVRGAVIMRDKDGNESSIAIFATKPDIVSLPKTDFSVHVYESVV